MSHRFFANIFYAPFTNLIWNLPGKKKKLYLTFDDGPHPETTPFLLKILSEYQVPAVFFLNGKNLEEYGQEVGKFNFGNHDLGNHAYGHRPLFFRRRRQIRQELSQTDRLIEQYYNRKTNLFRPPYGLWGPSLYQVLDQLKKDMVLWSVMSYDFKWPAEKCFNHVIENLKEGDIILFHDSPSSLQTVRDVLPAFLEYSLSHDFEFSLFHH